MEITNIVMAINNQIGPVDKEKPGEKQASYKPSKFASQVSLPRKAIQQSQQAQEEERNLPTNHNSTQSSRTPINNLKHLQESWVDPALKTGDLSGQLGQLTSEKVNLTLVSKSVEPKVSQDPTQNMNFILKTNIREEQLLSKNFAAKPITPVVHLPVITEQAVTNLLTEPAEALVNKSYATRNLPDCTVMLADQSQPAGQRNLTAKTISAQSEDQSPATVMAMKAKLQLTNYYEGMHKSLESQSPSFINIAAMATQQPLTVITKKPSNIVVWSFQGGTPEYVHDYSPALQQQIAQASNSALPRQLISGEKLKDSLTSNKNNQSKGQDSVGKPTPEPDKTERSKSIISGRSPSKLQIRESPMRTHSELRAIQPQVFLYGGVMSRKATLSTKKKRISNDTRLDTEKGPERESTHFHVVIPADKVKESQPTEGFLRSEQSVYLHQSSEQALQLSSSSARSVNQNYEVNMFQNPTMLVHQPGDTSRSSLRQPEQVTERLQPTIGQEPGIALQSMQLMPAALASKQNNKRKTSEGRQSDRKLNEDLNTSSLEQTQVLWKTTELKVAARKSVQSRPKPLVKSKAQNANQKRSRPRFAALSPKSTYNSASVVLSRIGSPNHNGPLPTQTQNILELKQMNMPSSRVSNLEQQSTQKFDQEELGLENSMVQSLTDSTQKLGTGSLPRHEQTIKALYVTYTNQEDQHKSIEKSQSLATNEDDYYVMPSISKPSDALMIQGIKLNNKIKPTKQKPNIPPITLAQQTEIQELQNLIKTSPERKPDKSADRDLGDVDVMNQGVGTQDLLELSQDTLFQDGSKRESLSKSAEELKPLQIKQLLSKLVNNIEIELQVVQETGKARDQSRLKKIQQLVHQGKFQPQVSCLCAELDLKPEDFVKVVNSYLRNPRVILKDPHGTHKVLHVTDAGTHKDQSMIRQVLSESICVSGQNIKEIIRHNPHKWTMSKQARVDTETSARRMEKSLDNFMGYRNDLFNQHLNVEVPQQMFGPLAYQNSLPIRKDHKTSEDVQTELHPNEEMRSSIQRESSLSQIGLTNKKVDTKFNNSLNISEENGDLLSQIDKYVSRQKNWQTNQSADYGQIVPKPGKSSVVQVKKRIHEGLSPDIQECSPEGNFLLPIGVFTQTEEPAFQDFGETQWQPMKISNLLVYDQKMPTFDGKLMKTMQTFQTQSLQKQGTFSSIDRTKHGSQYEEKTVKHRCRPDDTSSFVPARKVSNESTSTARRISHHETQEEHLSQINNFNKGARNLSSSQRTLSHQNLNEITLFVGTKPGPFQPDEMLVLQNQNYRESVESDNFLMQSRLRSTSPQTTGINVVPKGSQRSFMRKQIGVNKSKQGMIASISKTFGRALSNKSTQMLIKIKTDQARKSSMTSNNRGESREPKVIRIGSRRISKTSDNLANQSVYLNDASHQSSLYAKPLQVTFKAKRSEDHRLSRLTNDSVSLLDIRTPQFIKTTFIDAKAQGEKRASEGQNFYIPFQPSEMFNQLRDHKPVTFTRAAESSIKIDVQATSKSNGVDQSHLIVKEFSQRNGSGRNNRMTIETLMSKTHRVQADQTQLKNEVHASELQDESVANRLQYLEQERASLLSQARADSMVSLAGQQILGPPNVLNLTESFLVGQKGIQKRVQSQCLAQRPKNPAMQRRFETREKESDAQTRSQLLLNFHRSMEQAQSNTMLGGQREFLFDPNAESSLDLRHRTFLENLKIDNMHTKSVLQRPLQNKDRQNRDIGFWTDAWPKQLGHKSDAMMTKYSDNTRNHAADEARRGAYSSTQGSALPFESRPMTHQLKRRLPMGTQSDQSLFTSMERPYKQGSSLEQLLSAKGQEQMAVNEIKHRIMQKSQTAFQSRCRSKIKKGVAGTGKSDYVTRQDGIRIIQ